LTVVLGDDADNRSVFMVLYQRQRRRCKPDGDASARRCGRKKVVQRKISQLAVDQIHSAVTVTAWKLRVLRGGMKRVAGDDVSPQRAQPVGVLCGLRRPRLDHVV